MIRNGKNPAEIPAAGDGEQADRLAARRICVELKTATKAIVAALRIMRKQGGAVAHVRFLEVAHMLELASAFGHDYALKYRKGVR